jgi:hypothetical protein
MEEHEACGLPGMVNGSSFLFIDVHVYRREKIQSGRDGREKRGVQAREI